MLLGQSGVDENIRKKPLESIGCGEVTQFSDSGFTAGHPLKKQQSFSNLHTPFERLPHNPYIHQAIVARRSRAEAGRDIASLLSHRDSSAEESRQGLPLRVAPSTLR